MTLVYGFTQGRLPASLTNLFQAKAGEEAFGIVMRLENGGSLEDHLYKKGTQVQHCMDNANHGTLLESHFELFLIIPNPLPLFLTSYLSLRYPVHLDREDSYHCWYLQRLDCIA